MTTNLDELMELLRLDHEVLLGDLSDSTRDDVVREAHRSLASNCLNAIDAIKSLRAERDKLLWIVEQIKMQAQTWAGEAKCQTNTVQEIYRLVSGKTGEKGDWNGAKPVANLIAERDALRECVTKYINLEDERWLDRLSKTMSLPLRFKRMTKKRRQEWMDEKAANIDKARTLIGDPD